MISGQMTLALSTQVESLLKSKLSSRMQTLLNRSHQHPKKRMTLELMTPGLTTRARSHRKLKHRSRVTVVLPLNLHKLCLRNLQKLTVLKQMTLVLTNLARFQLKLVKKLMEQSKQRQKSLHLKFQTSHRSQQRQLQRSPHYSKFSKRMTPSRIQSTIETQRAPSTAKLSQTQLS